jgi:RNA polymerase sigma factor, sigma-70 family
MENLLMPHINERKSEKALPREQDDISLIYHRHIETVYRVCFSLMGNKADAEDTSQAVFLKLIKNNTQFSDTEHEKAWLITTARNCCRDIHRQWWRKRVSALEPTIEALNADSYETDTTLEALMQLPPKLRIVIYLHYYEGYKLSEISEILKLNINTVKTQIRTAKKRLKMELEDNNE